MKNIIGRKKELKILSEALNSRQSEFIAVYGRRRIGKTFLLHHYFSSTRNCIYFHMTGIRKGSYKEHLSIFTESLAETFYAGANLKIPENWHNAFDMLNNAIKTVKKEKKIVLFFDEFPWVASRRSGILGALEYAWNHTWALEGRIKLIICGSSSSWILNNIINNTGGLYNRVTVRLGLEPFTLSETSDFLKNRGIKLGHKQIVELYMVMGGIPFYLSQISKGLSVAQIIDNLFFNKNSTLYKEYMLLLASLFENHDEYDLIIREIAKYRYGINQADLLKKKNISRGGRTISRLRSLEEVGFIKSFIPMAHKQKGKYYKINDEYILFYLHWIEPNMKNLGGGIKLWLHHSQSTAWKVWAGLAFESLCFKHTDKILTKLGIDTALTIDSWRHSSIPGTGDQGAQIDLLFDRSDDAITICEIKYSVKPFNIDKEYAKNIANKINVFRMGIRTNKQILLAFIAASGLKETHYSNELVDGVVTLDDLF